ncbi:winged helix-turn-helix domain-containing protein [Ornithinicoccus hortensis]|uniref:Transcriptional regulator n=1 Tax=Ornithinicoccus hortensis TaxID=82346 RepID=A0A542YVY2_9MICO|nr:winged helix-turn-helix domain-containing protein [Ornithinicoccus hortensis]TQL52222.1 transcriptional regulator [Ornithinicoccus hortensis]
MTQVVPFLMGAESTGAPSVATSDLLVLVAETVEQRTRLMARLGALGPVLVVSSAEEAQRILAGTAAPAERVAGQAPAGHGAEVPDRASGSGARERPRPTPPVALLAAPGLRIVADRQVLTAGTREVQLTPLEFALFSALASDLGRVWSFAALSEQVWGTPHVGDASQVHAVVKRLRRKLNNLPAPIVVEAVRGIGFRAVTRRHISAVGPKPGS